MKAVLAKSLLVEKAAKKEFNDVAECFNKLQVSLKGEKLSNILSDSALKNHFDYTHKGILLTGTIDKTSDEFVVKLISKEKNLLVNFTPVKTSEITNENENDDELER